MRNLVLEALAGTNYTFNVLDGLGIQGWHGLTAIEKNAEIRKRLQADENLISNALDQINL